MKNKISFPVFLAMLVFFCSTNVFAQKMPDMKMVEAQLAKAQHILDSAKKLHPEIPSDTKLKKLPNMDSLSALTKKNSDVLKNIQGQAKQQRDDNLPKSIAANNAFDIKVPNEKDIITIAQKMLPAAIEGLNRYNILLKDMLDQSVNDTTINVAGTGMMLSATGMPKQVCQYMVCKDVIRNPKNVWTINDLGVILRNEKRYPESIQCFKYACSFSDSLYIIKTNLAWATSYYGDFIQAKKYFNEALAIDPDFGSAMEGLALIAYQQGDIQALFTCLSKEVKGFGGGGPGPSDNFANICGSVATDQQMNNLGNANQSNPSDDHTYDNDTGDEGNQDPPPTADNEPPSYPSMGGIFAQSIDELPAFRQKLASFYKMIKDAQKKEADRVAEKQHSLPRLAPPTYTDDQGNQVTPYSYEKYYKLFHTIHESFEKRASYIYKQWDDEMKPLLLSIATKDGDMFKAYTKELAACKFSDAVKEKKCIEDAECKWKPIMRGSKAADLGAISILWKKYIEQLNAASDWYIGASSPFIKRVHQPDWNEYMNRVREQDIRGAVLNMYEKWVGWQASINIDALHDLQVECRTEIREIPANGPNPKDVKLKKLKTAPDYCDNKVSGRDYTIKGFGYKSDCSGTTITVPIGKVGPADVGLVYKTSISSRHKEDDYSRLGLTLGMGVSQKIGANGAGGSGASMTGSIDLTIEAGYQFGADGSVNGKYASTELAVGTKGKVTTGDDNADALLHTAKFNKGFDIKVEVVALKGADGTYGGWNVTDVDGTRH